MGIQTIKTDLAAEFNPNNLNYGKIDKRVVAAQKDEAAKISQENAKKKVTIQNLGKIVDLEV